MADGGGCSEVSNSASLALEWLDRDIRPRLIVNLSLRIIWQNEAAKIALGQRCDLEVRDGLLAVTHNAHQNALGAFIASCTHDLCSFCLPSDALDSHLLFRAQELTRDGRNRLFGIIFYRSGKEYIARYADLDRVFLLTHAEHRVLLELLNGHTADDVARDLAVSIETTRSHIRNIYGKIGVTSREGLFSRVRPYQV